MGWVSVIIEGLIAVLKGFFGTDETKKETVREADQDADIDAALANPDRLPDPDKLRDDRSGEGT